jgi:hypothetical protein
MSALTLKDLHSIEEYGRIRPDFRTKVMQHKDIRRVALGEHAALYFEDALTMQYQIQEAMRLEHMVEPAQIQEELDVYNPLIPDGSNWKATFMVEYPEVEERRAALARLIGIEKAVWVQVQGFPKVAPIANEDLDRATEDKTSAVHFLRFELTPEMVAAAKRGAGLRAGIDYPHYRAEVELSLAVQASLVADLR